MKVYIVDDSGSDCLSFDHVFLSEDAAKNYILSLHDPDRYDIQPDRWVETDCDAGDCKTLLVYDKKFGYDCWPNKALLFEREVVDAI